MFGYQKRNRSWIFDLWCHLFAAVSSARLQVRFLEYVFWFWYTHEFVCRFRGPGDATYSIACRKRSEKDRTHLHGSIRRGNRKCVATMRSWRKWIQIFYVNLLKPLVLGAVIYPYDKELRYFWRDEFSRSWTHFERNSSRGTECSNSGRKLFDSGRGGFSCHTCRSVMGMRGEVRFLILDILDWV